MTYRIVPRTEYGLPAVVKNSDGSLRPPLYNEKWMTAHYTGNNVDYTNKDVEAVIRQIQAIFGKSKPFEYNYAIGQQNDDEIHEFAGTFQAAHSAGENLDSFGVLFLLGVGEPLTELMINKWRWLREVLIYTGRLKPDVVQLPHYLMPDAKTQCPGPVVMNDWARLLLPYWEEQRTQPTTPIGEIMGMKPQRLYDSRVKGMYSGNPFKPGQIYTLGLQGMPDVPATAEGIFVTVTADAPVGEGFATIWDGDGAQPVPSNLNWTKESAAIANTTYTNLNQGTFKIVVSSETHLIFDVVAYV